MKPIQITMDPELLRQLDALPEVKMGGRSAFLRRLIEAYLRSRREREIREAYHKGYGAKPVQAGEFDVDPEHMAWPAE